MRGTTWSIVPLVAVVCVLSMVTLMVMGECPNGCSGNGDCMAKDMCNCYKNYQGNDCGDRTCLFGRAHVDTPKGDINMDKNRLSPGWILTNSQQDPAQTYEYFNPDAVADEAHFYMECSNKGICDRTTGLCQCFDGYEGNGCQRTTCPAKCNGHGTCESARELASKNVGTLFGQEGSVGAVTYDLWDSNSTYGCRCDPWFHGPDCNKRNCKVGVDPLYLSVGSPTYETFVIHAGAATAAEVGPTSTDAWIRLRVFDYHGESFITKKINILDDTDATNGATYKTTNAKAVADAITGVPNLTFGKIKCNPTGLTDTDLRFFKSARPATAVKGLSVTCQYTGNPGRMRIPEIAAKKGATAAWVVTTSQQGQDEDWFTYKTAFASQSNTGTTVTLLDDSAEPTSLDGKFIKIGPHVVKVVSHARRAATNPVTPNDPLPWQLTLEYALNHAVGSKAPIFTTDPDTWLSFTAVEVLSAALTVGSDLMTFGAKPALFTTGDLLFFQNAFFYVQELSNAAPFTARLHKPFGGAAADGADVTAGATPFKITTGDKTKPYRYVSQCSNRGMCGFETGICTCFKGYTNDNCDTQNILAL
jgi:hypothetical protein